MKKKKKKDRGPKVPVFKKEGRFILFSHQTESCLGVTFRETLLGGKIQEAICPTK